MSLAMGLSISAAHANVINFDNIDVSGGPVAVTNQYAAQGVTFSSASAYTVSDGVHAPLTASGLLLVSYPFISSPTAGAIFTTQVKATFSTDVSNVSLIFADTEIGSVLGSMSAFDFNGNLLGTTGNITTPNNANFGGVAVGELTLALNYSGIRSVVFNTDSDGAIVDNLSFTPAVPEPEIYAMMVAGLGMTGFFARRRKSVLNRIA